MMSGNTVCNMLWYVPCEVLSWVFLCLHDPSVQWGKECELHMGTVWSPCIGVLRDRMMLPAICMQELKQDVLYAQLKNVCEMQHVSA